MSEHVKPGQVWMDKSTGRQWTVFNHPTLHDHASWLRLKSGNLVHDIREDHLVDDFILVKDAP